MVIDGLFLLIALIVLLIGSYTDIKTREVPDWLNFGLIAIGLGTRAIFSVATQDWSHIIYGLAGFTAFFVLAYIMFYSGQWGGGDAKLIMGLGALFGLRLDIYDFSISFIINSFIIGAFFAVLYSIYLVCKNKKKFKKELMKYRQKKVFRVLRIVAAVIVVIGLILFFVLQNVLLKFYLITTLFLIVLMFYFWLVVKAIEKAGMYKLVDPSKLTEGDWIAKDIKVNGKYIAGPKDLGIEMKQIKKLIEFKKKGKIDKVLIKEGMPFVPSFLASFIFTYFFGSILSLIVNNLK